MKDATSASEEVCKFVCDDFHCFQNFVFVSGTGNDHFTATENQADNFGVIESINQPGGLFRFVLDFVEWEVECEVVEV